MHLQLIEIGEDGFPAGNLPLDDTARSVCEAIAAMYRQAGFVRPWLGYLAVEDERVVGTCAFKSPPRDGRVEIAYFTFPEHEGRGIATEMARQLVRLAQAADHGVVIVARTLPEENASSAVLRKLGFRRTGIAHDAKSG